MIQYLASILLFTVIFVFFPSSHPNWSVQVFEVWIWDKDGGYGTKPGKISEDPTKTLSGYKTKNKFFSFPAGRFFPIGGDRLVEYALFDEGFYEYKKLGDEVSYFNGWRELFWKKPYSSYPRPGFYSSILPLVSGDGNTIFFADRNGNPSSTISVDGRFATDICYGAEVDHTLVLFSGGEFFLLDGKGEILKQYEYAGVENHKDTYFAKSCAVAPNGEAFAIHFQEGESDKIHVYNAKGSRFEIDLGQVYPHRVHFAINNESEILIFLDQSIKLMSHKGNIIHSQDNLQTDRYYNPVLALGEFFLWGTKDGMNIWNRDGELQYNRKLSNQTLPYRFLPGKEKNTFYVESKSTISQIIINPPHR